MRSNRCVRPLLVGAALLLASASWLVTGCGDEVTINYPNSPPEVDLTGLTPPVALTGDLYQLPLDPYVADDWDAVGDLTFTVLSVSTPDGTGAFAGGTYENSFTVVGDVTVQFSVADSSGLLSISSFAVHVDRGPFASNVHPPTAALSVWPAYPLVGRNTQFDASASYDLDGDPLSFIWDFGDGSGFGPALVNKTEHAYAADRPFAPNVFVGDGELASIAMKNINVWRPSAFQVDSWSRVDSWTARGTYSSLAVDDAGDLHVAYYDPGNECLMYATDASGAWVATQVVDKASPETSSYGKFCSIATSGSAGVDLVIHFSYFGEDTYDLRYATYTESSGLWDSMQVDVQFLTTTGQHTSIATRGAAAHIAYTRSALGSVSLRHAFGIMGGPVTTEEVAPPGGLFDSFAYTSIGLDDLGPPYDVHISYVHTALLADPAVNELKYAVGVWDGFTNYSWSPETVQGARVNYETSIAVEAAGTVHISYYDTGSGLNYAFGTAGSWTIEDVASDTQQGQYSSIALDGVGAPFISFYDDAEGNLLFARRLGADSWESETADDGDTLDRFGRAGTYASMKWNAALGQFDVVYYDEVHGFLKHTGGVWNGWPAESEVVDGPDSGNYVDVALDDGGGANACWYDAENGALMYAYNPAPEPMGGASYLWTVQQVESGIARAGVGAWCSIAAEGSGSARIVHIAYADLDTSALKYATWDQANGWRYEPVATSAGFSMAFTRIAIDGGTVHIAYVDASQEDPLLGTLYYIAGTFGSWGTAESVDASAPSPFAPAMVIDGGDVHLTYMDVDLTGSDAVMRYATDASGGWSVEDVIDLSGVSGPAIRTGLAVVGTTLHMTSPSVTGNLLHAYKDIGGGAWTFEGIDTGPFAGFASELLAGPNGELYACYVDLIMQEVKLAQRMTDGTWASDALDSTDLPGQFLASEVDALSGSVHVMWFTSPDVPASGGIVHGYSHGIGLRTAVAFFDADDFEPDADIGKVDTAIAPNKSAHVVFVDAQYDLLWYATNDGGLWVRETISQGLGVRERPRIVVDAAGGIHVVYTTDWPVAGDLWYATKDASGLWQKEIVSGDFNGFYPSLAIDASGTVHIAYSDWDSGNLLYVSGVAGAWGAVLDLGEVGYVCDIVLDSNGFPHVAYYKGQLWHATNESGGWLTEAVDDGSTTGSTNTGLYPSATISGTVLHVSYYDVDNDQIMYARGSWGNWPTIEVVTPLALQKSSIALGPAGMPTVIGNDAARTRYAVREAADEWAGYVADSGSAFDFVPLTIDADGTMYFTYVQQKSAGHSVKYVFGPMGNVP